MDSLKRFIDAQEHSYDIALSELKAGEKRSHWIWYIFPQLKGLGYSYNSQYYGIDGKNEAISYLEHPILGSRIREAASAILNITGRDIVSIMSEIDAMKLKSSMTLFDAISPNDVFAMVLKQYYGDKRDGKTIQLINNEKNGR